MTAATEQALTPDHSDDAMVAHRAALVTGGTRGIGAAVDQGVLADGGRAATRAVVPYRSGRGEKPLVELACGRAG
jgi:NAD(P)-dependent dehydrogenase (short-subunit alcohol dehydrogenase family)